MENYSLLKNSKIIKIANNKKNKKINNLLLLRDEMINNNIDDQIIQKYINEQYEIINTEYQKNINKKGDTQKIMNKKRDDALQFLFKNKIFLEQNNANPEYIKEYVKNQYNDINKTYENDNINFID
jgi:hypothetical protein